jgi:hypothetical protein
MRVSRSERSTNVFVLTRPLLEAFAAKVSARLPRLTIKAKCLDGLNREFGSLGELFDFRNPERAQISELLLVARSESFGDRFSITLDSDEYKNVHISVDAEEEVGIYLNELSNDFVASLRPWYAWIARVDVDIVLLVLWLAFVISNLWKAKSLSFELPRSIDLVPLAVGTALGLIPLTAAIFLKRLVRRFFPKAVFAIGDGEQRHSGRETTRTVLILGFMVSVVASVVVSWFL